MVKATGLEKVMEVELTADCKSHSIETTIFPYRMEFQSIFHPLLSRLEANPLIEGLTAPKLFRFDRGSFRHPLNAHIDCLC